MVGGEELWADGGVTVRQAADRGFPGRTTLFEAMGRGELPFVRMGKRRIIPVRALRMWMAAKTEGGERFAQAVAS